MATDTEEVLDFEEEGIFTTGITVKDDTTSFRISAKTKEDFQHWKNLYMNRTNTCFNVRRGFPVVRKVFRQVLVCHHGIQHLGKKKTFTG